MCISLVVKKMKKIVTCVCIECNYNKEIIITFVRIVVEYITRTRKLLYCEITRALDTLTCLSLQHFSSPMKFDAISLKCGRIMKYIMHKKYIMK